MSRAKKTNTPGHGKIGIVRGFGTVKCTGRNVETVTWAKFNTLAMFLITAEFPNFASDCTNNNYRIGVLMNI
jgi:hypothetical protein